MFPHAFSPVAMEASKPTKDTSSKSQPSCELCQRRKVRCDKGNPCSTCRRAGVKCEVSTRQRLPRGRNGGRRKGDTDLKARIAKLENLVSNLSGDTAHNSNSPSSGLDHKCDEKPQREPSDGMSRYLGGSFWSNLTNEVCRSSCTINDHTISHLKEDEMIDEILIIGA